MVKRLIVVSLVAVVFASCNNSGPSKSHGPIVLGDSSTIVTETDPSKLQDMVTDLNPTIASPEPQDAPAPQTPPPAKAQDTPKKSVAVAIPTPPQPAQLNGAGLKADFNIMSLLIPGIAAKQAGKPDLSKANGAVFTFASGTLNNNVLKVTANVTKVSQRYQSVVVLKNELGMLPLETLTTTTDWEPMKGAGNVYRITGLDEKNLDHPDANKGTIQSAVMKAAQRHHMNRKRAQQWVNSVHNVKSVNQKPLYVMLRSVMWKIDGKDGNGKPFSKQIRLDFPM